MSQENVEIVRRLFEQWAAGDLTADCFGPDNWDRAEALEAAGVSE